MGKNLERTASALLNPKRGFVKHRGISAVSVSDGQLDRRLQRDRAIRIRTNCQTEFRKLSTSVRREITARFKERARNPKLDWNAFLAQEIG
jgi:hypothetical protein